VKAMAENENKMQQVAAMFGKKLGERFQVKIDNQIYDCSFEEYGLNSYGAYENPYLSFDAFILQELLTGTAVIVDE
jgi:DNA polymerase I-like protein with 3'-5' exonuclease and polymerase domains